MRQHVYLNKSSEEVVDIKTLYAKIGELTLEKETLEKETLEKETLEKELYN